MVLFLFFRKESKYVQNMVEILLQENNNLKHELESCYQKVAKSQKVFKKLVFKE